MRIIIAGGGVGGLALAQGLARRGIEPFVLECDQDLSVAGDVMMQLGPAACDAVKALVPAHVWDAFRNSAEISPGSWLGLRDCQGNDQDNDQLVTQEDIAHIDRGSLRRILATDLGKYLQLGTRCVGFKEVPDGVIVHTADGQDYLGDGLIIATGGQESLRGQVPGAPGPKELAVAAFGGAIAAADLRIGEAEFAHQESWLAVGQGGWAVSAHYFGAGDPTVYWELYAPKAALVGDAESATGAETEPTAAEAFEEAKRLFAGQDWDPSIHKIVAAAQYSVAAVPLIAPGEDAAWQPKRVTLFGAAAYPTPSLGGAGAHHSLCDAAELAKTLGLVQRGKATLAGALEEGANHAREEAPARAAVPLGLIDIIVGGLTPQAKSGTTWGVQPAPRRPLLARLFRRK